LLIHRPLIAFLRYAVNPRTWNSVMAGKIHLYTSFGGLLSLLIVELWPHDCLRRFALKILINLWLRLVVLWIKNVVVVVLKILAELGRMASAAIIELLLT